MMKNLIALVLFGVSMTMALPPAIAAPAAPAKKQAKKKVSKKAAAKKAAVPATAAAAAAAAHEHEVDPTESDIADSLATDFSCELGNKLTLYANPEIDNQVTLRWKKQLLKMRPVGTTTGASRFESSKHGLLWIGIPSKGMLLDTKKGKQLANECKNAAQLAQTTGTVTPPAPPSLLVQQ